MAFGFITLLRLFPSKNPSKEELRSFAIKLLVAEFINITMYAFLNLAVGINSIYAYSLSSAIIWIFVIWKRRDLFPLAIATAIVIGLSTFIFYYLFQFIVGTGYLHSVWLLGPTTHSLNLLGIEVPLTEVLFGALVAPFYGVLVPYLANFKYKRRVTK
jgi:hypothetical protein